jgi:Flp pilus assembly protein TadD
MFVAAAALLLAACATRETTDAGSDADRDRPARETADRRAGPDRERPARESTTPSAGRRSDVAPAEDADAISRVLAERRRGDYPEIEVLESGFTITEQVQIRSDARTDYERAIALLGQERYDEGIAILRGVVDSTPDATSPYIDLAIAYGHVGELALAEESLAAASLLSPNNPVVHNELGIVYRRTGRFDEARASYEQALAVYGDFHYARRNLAVLCDLYLADLTCALLHYRTYLESVGGDPEVEIWVADIENRLGN